MRNEQLGIGDSKKYIEETLKRGVGRGDPTPPKLEYEVTSQSSNTPWLHRSAYSTHYSIKIRSIPSPTSNSSLLILIASTPNY